MSVRLKVRLWLASAIFCWLLFSATNLYLLFVERYDMKVRLSDFIPQLLLSGFVLCVFAYYRYTITKADRLNFTDLLWKVFITGLFTTLMSLGIRLFFIVFFKKQYRRKPADSKLLLLCFDRSGRRFYGLYIRYLETAHPLSKDQKAIENVGVLRNCITGFTGI